MAARSFVSSFSQRSVPSRQHALEVCVWRRGCCQRVSANRSTATSMASAVSKTSAYKPCWLPSEQTSTSRVDGQDAHRGRAHLSLDGRIRPQMDRCPPQVQKLDRRVLGGEAMVDGRRHPHHHRRFALTRPMTNLGHVRMALMTRAKPLKKAKPLLRWRWPRVRQSWLQRRTHGRQQIEHEYFDVVLPSRVRHMVGQLLEDGRGQAVGGRVEERDGPTPRSSTSLWTRRPWLSCGCSAPRSRAASHRCTPDVDVRWARGSRSSLPLGNPAWRRPRQTSPQRCRSECPAR